MTIYFLVCAILMLISLMVIVATFDNKKRINFYYLLLMIIMTLANYGYLKISIASSVEEALIANQLCYLGGCFGPPVILCLICTICNFNLKALWRNLAFGYGLFVYLLVLTTEYTKFYYKDAWMDEYMGVTTVGQINGIGYSFFYVILFGYIFIQIGLILYSLITKRSVSRKSLWILLVLEIVNAGGFVIVRAINVNFEIMPLLYVIDSVFCLFLYFKGLAYNVEDNLISAFIRQDTYGYIMLDNKYKYMGCTKVALALFPELKEYEVDKIIDKDKCSFNFILDKVDKLFDKNEEYFGFESGEQHYECRIRRIWNQGKATGYMIELCEDTDKWKYTKLISNYNSELEKTRFELAKKVGEQTAELRNKEKAISDLYTQTVSALSEAVDAKDRYTSGHSDRVAYYAKLIAQRMGKSEEEQDAIYRAGLLHDVGKIRIPEEIINKPGKLTDEEYGIIKIHAVTGYHILRGISGGSDIAIAAKYHHERYDGKGYPNGLKGEHIPEIARILGVADSYDAMTSNRSYRKGLPQNVVREEIEKGRGTQFDPKVADVMLGLMDEDVNYEMRQLDNMFRRILVVDDEPMNFKLITHIMNEEPSYEIKFANSGALALDMLDLEEYDLILLDVKMPGMDGIDVLKAIRKKYSIPVVLMTGDRNLDTSVGFQQLGCDDYITKPFVPILIKEVIHNMTERNKTINK